MRDNRVAMPALMLFATWLLMPWLSHAMRADRMAELREETVEMFYHGFTNYMQHAFPEDEVCAICSGR